jgi:hypothetical protein
VRRHSAKIVLASVSLLSLDLAPAHSMAVAAKCACRSSAMRARASLSFSSASAHLGLGMERILVDDGSAISPSAAPSQSRSPISFASTARVDPAQRDRKTAVPFHEIASRHGIVRDAA